MTVGEMIELLKQQDPERLVLMARDPEGNGFYAFSGDVWACLAEADGRDYEPFDPEESDEGYGPREGEPALVLWP